MENNYDKYLIAFNNLSLEDKRDYILENIDEIMKLFYKINLDYNNNCDILPTNEYETEEEYLMELFKKIISLKGISGVTAKIIADNLYE